ncbi:hypothetical protein KCU93_g456, partial [Aureobasidium melanogenum]
MLVVSFFGWIEVQLKWRSIGRAYPRRKGTRMLATLGSKTNWWSKVSRLSLASFELFNCIPVNGRRRIVELFMRVVTCRAVIRVPLGDASVFIPPWMERKH